MNVEHAFNPELRQQQAELDAYNDQRPYQDDRGYAHDPNGKFINVDGYFDGIREQHYSDGLEAASYEDMSMIELSKRLAEAEVTNDITTQDDVLDVLLGKIDEFVDKSKASHGPNNTSEDVHGAWLGRLMKVKDSYKSELTDLSKSESLGTDKTVSRTIKVEKEAEVKSENAVSEAELGFPDWVNDAATSKKEEEPKVELVVETPARASEVDLDLPAPAVDVPEPAEPVVVELPKREGTPVPAVAELTQAEKDDADAKPKTYDLGDDGAPAFVLPDDDGPVLVEGSIQDHLSRNPSYKGLHDVVPEGSFDDTVQAPVEAEVPDLPVQTPHVAARPRHPQRRPKAADKIDEPQDPVIVTREDLGQEVEEPQIPARPVGSLYKRLRAIDKPSKDDEAVIDLTDEQKAKLTSPELKTLQGKLETTRKEYARIVSGRKGASFFSPKYTQKKVADAEAAYRLASNKLIEEGVSLLQGADYSPEDVKGLVNVFKIEEAYTLVDTQRGITLETKEGKRLEKFFQAWSDDKLPARSKVGFFAKGGGMFAVASGVAVELIGNTDLPLTPESAKLTAAAAVFGFLGGANKSGNRLARGLNMTQITAPVRTRRGVVKGRIVREDYYTRKMKDGMDEEVAEASLAGKIVEDEALNLVVNQAIEERRKNGRTATRKIFSRRPKAPRAVANTPAEAPKPSEPEIEKLPTRSRTTS